ncbi:MAG: fructokinase [Chromatiales bacterium 21-64-14]|nr:MAG: fructokinase [Chromatiales bacterium 21-64-14]HQU15951.1 ROK family protein [Gammaproteobacteria bacterium]
MIRFGIDLGGTKTEIIALDPTGVERLRHRVATPQGDYPGILRTIAALVHDAERELDAPGSVGVGTPGALSRATGRLRNSNTPCLNGQPLLRDLGDTLQRPVRMENDANCFALSEATDGAGGGCAVVFGVIVGTGTGGGIVAHGRLLAGINAIAGEWGHNPLPWPNDDERPGPACYCGRHGCIETFLSGPGLTDDHHRTTGVRLAPAEIAAHAERGDPGARHSLDRYAGRMARALAHVINLLDPDVIVLGGGLSNLGYLYETVPRLWQHHVFSDRVNTRLLPPRHGDSSGARGAAWLW